MVMEIRGRHRPRPMRHTKDLKETDLAAAVVELLSADLEVYQEVKVGGGVVDIIATPTGSPVLWAVEVKRAGSLAVLGQALHNKTFAHYSSVAVPAMRRGGNSSRAFDRFLRQNGIGLIELSWGLNGTMYATETVPAKFNRKALYRWVHLHEAQKDFAPAGTANGGAYTPFKGTKATLIEYVTRHPGCTLKQAFEAIDHHYKRLSTAMISTRQWIISGVISELRLEEDRLYLVEK